MAAFAASYCVFVMSYTCMVMSDMAARGGGRRASAPRARRRGVCRDRRPTGGGGEDWVLRWLKRVGPARRPSRVLDESNGARPRHWHPALGTARAGRGK